MPGTVLLDVDAVTFTVDDPGHELAGVWLRHELAGLDRRLPFARADGGWRLRLPRPPVARMEYLLEREHVDGSHAVGPDPDNPSRAPGAFGEKSEVTWPDYRPPEWVQQPAPDGSVTASLIRSRSLRGDVETLLWTAPTLEPGARAPLLVVLDGPEYAALASLTRCLETACATGRIPPLRAALLAPRHRDDDYSASVTHSRALVQELLPALAPLAAGRPLGIGASLGGLAMLHAAREHPGAFAGVFLQSGSFFDPQLDGHESGFSRWSRVTRYVRRVLRAEAAPEPLRVVMTAGTGEENFANNEQMAAALDRQGCRVTFVPHPDAHNWISWRDSFDPALLDLVDEVTA